MRRLSALLTVAMCSLVATAYGQSSTTVGFDGGDPGGFSGNALFEATGGNPGGAARHLGIFFFNELRTGAPGEPANPGFLGNYSTSVTVSFSIDVKTNQLDDFIGNPIARPIGISLIDRDVTGPSGPSGVFFEVGILSVASTPDWTTLSVTIDDPTSNALPPGWIGFGDEDPITFEPVLPPGASFATVLASVDEFQVTGAVPGFFYTDAIFDVQIDNISVTREGGSVPARTLSWSSMKDLFGE